MPEPPKIVYVNFSEEINPQRVNQFIAFCSQILQQQKPDVLQINFASPGGNVGAGIILYNFLKALPVKLVMHNIGAVDSIAVVVFLAGSERLANSNASFLFHGVVAGFPAQSALNLYQLKERLSGLEVDQDKISKTITDLTKITQTEIDSIYLQGEVKSPQFALEKGLIHQIKDLAIPKDAVIFSFI